MARHHRFARLYLAAGLISATAWGCAPSYPALQVPTALQDICRKEHGLDVQVRVIDKTLTVYASSLHDLLTFEGDSEEPRLGESVNDLIQSVHRVALSTDLPIDFYTVVMRDAVWPIEFKLTRSLDDVRRADAYAIPWMELNARSLQDFRQVGPDAPTDAALERPVVLRQFALDQIRQRLEQHWANAGLFDPETLRQASVTPPVTVRWDEGTVLVTVHASFQPAEEAVPQQTAAETQLREALKIVAHVVKAYRLAGLRDVIVRYDPTGQSLQLPADDLRRLSLDLKLSDY